ncbi:MAG: ImmA/IrrE family metallo-endopeptidase [Acidimicrobiia bacterium]|nr:ImmA/IrrE family metallo-endopeptidase [Acidimicrobiia bacterium]
MSANPERLAHWLFDSFEVSPRPPIDLETLAVRMGIDQVLDTDMVEDGRLVQSSDRAVVHLRLNLHPRRRRFTLAHELAHRILTHPEAPAVSYRRAGNGDDEERLCDQIAASILMPQDWTRRFATRPQNLSTLRLMSERAQVSLSAALVRSREINNWRKSLLRFSLDQGRWRFQGAFGVPIEWHRRIRSAPATHDAINSVPIRRDWDCQLPLRAAESEISVTAQIDRWKNTTVALVELDERLAHRKPDG